MISNASQENEVEARALVAHLKRIVRDETYYEASIGVIALFEEQAALLQQMVTEEIPEEEWEEHELVVVTPDGFQGDERDVILYSLSWDNRVMPRQALSQRQREHPHEQGMLNVAFTRARDEMHVFHSAPIDTFTKADGSDGALTRWLRHCGAVQGAGRTRPTNSRLGNVDSEFEGEVAQALRQHGLTVLHQYPACGFHIDLVCEHGGRRLAVECDGERFHLDEHGQPRLEDLEREAILRRAGWRILRIPYRKWARDPEAQVGRVLLAFQAIDDSEAGPSDEPPSEGPKDPQPTRGETTSRPARFVTPAQAAILEVLRTGVAGEDEVFRLVRDRLGSKRLTTRLRGILVAEAQRLNHLGLLTIEDHEYFVTPEGRARELRVREVGSGSRYGHRRRRRRW